MSNQNNIIEVVELSKVFETKTGEVHALDNINLEIKKGEIFGIIGESGAGKSTLIRCINCLEKPTSGSVIFEGQDLVAMGKKELLKTRQSMGMIFQQFNLLMQRNSMENVCFPLEIAKWPKKKARERAKELLATVGLSGKENSYPAQLSGGQQQRVAIARALATNPKVLLCDEATSALDPKTTRSILNLLKEINKEFNITIIIITHEMQVVEEICDRVAIINSSSITEVGKVDDMLKSIESL